MTRRAVVSECSGANAKTVLPSIANEWIIASMPTANVNLSTQQVDFIRSSIDTGRFQNVSEAVRAGLHLLQKQEEADRLKLEHLRRLADEGFAQIDGGDFELIDRHGVDAFLESVRATKAGKRKR
jgi:antitoxin ParD1/3/4